MVEGDELRSPPSGLPFKSDGPHDPLEVANADRIARFWRSDEVGELRAGGQRHKQAVCRMFRETFNPYKPTIIDWPKLDDDAKQRLVSLPIWDIAVQTEGRARRRMLSYAYSQPDPAWRAAIEQNGWEEGRHKTVLSNLVRAYGITLAPEPAYLEPRDPEWAYLVTGYSECVDSFFAFGLFALAKRSGFFPPELVETFEPVIQEECRHILLFANWVAWQRRTLPLVRRIWFEMRVVAVWGFLGWERLGMARGMEASSSGQSSDTQDNNFTVTGSKAISDSELSVRELMELCLEENDRRFAGYDPRLCRPTTMPYFARFASRILRVWQRSSRAGTAQA